MKYRLYTIAVCFGLAPAGIIAATTTRAAEPPTVDEIKSQLAQHRSQLQSLYIELTTDHRLAVDPKVYLTLPGHNEGVILAKTEQHYAMKGNKRYQRSLCPAVVKSPWPIKPPLFEVDPKASPAVQALQRFRQKLDKEDWDRVGSKVPRDEYHLMPDQTFAYNGKLQWDRQVPEAGKRASLIIMGADNSGHWGQPAAYLRSIGWSMADPTERDEKMVRRQQEDSFPDLFAAQPYTVAKTIATVDGTRCAVLHGNREMEIWVRGQGIESRPVNDTIWLDLDHGLAMKQRELIVGQDDFTRTVSSDFVEILPGVWFPKSVAVQYLVPPSGAEEYRGKPMRVSEMTLTKWIVNQVPDDLFDPVSRPAKDEDVHDMRLPRGLR